MSSGCLLVLVATMGLPEGSERETLAVLILSRDTQTVTLSEIYVEARRLVEAQTSVEVAPLETISLSERDAVLRTCAGEASCFAERVRSVGARIDYLLTVSVDRFQEASVLGLRLVDVERGVELGAHGEEVPAGMTLAGALELQLPQVFPPGLWGQVAELQVRTVPSQAEVEVSGQPCVAPCRFERMPPGHYEVRARKSGFEDAARTVELLPGQTTEVDVRLERPTKGLLQNPWFWVAVGVGVGGIVATSVAVASATSEPDRVPFCLTTDPSLCP